MRILYFAPVASTGQSLPTAATLQEALRHFAPLTLVDASHHYGIDTWNDFNDNHRMFVNAFDAVLLCAPKMARADRPAFFEGLRAYTASRQARPVIGYFSDIDVHTPFNLLKSGAAYAHRNCEHVGVLATYLMRAATQLAPAADAPPPWSIGPVTIDYAQKKAFVEGVAAKLTPDQFDLLEFLSRRKGRPYDQEMLMVALNKNPEIDAKMADVIVCKIRAALGAVHPDHPEAGDRLLRTVWGRGYFVVAKEADYAEPLPNKRGAAAQPLALPAPRALRQ